MVSRGVLFWWPSRSGTLVDLEELSPSPSSAFYASDQACTITSEGALARQKEGTEVIAILSSRYLFRI